MRDMEMADILLVVHGLKPSALFEISYPHRSPRAQSARQRNKVRVLEKILRGLGLRYALIMNPASGSKTAARLSGVARSRTTLNRLMSVEKEANIVKRRILLGKLLGYPKTAYMAFANDTTVQTAGLPMKVTTQAYFKFLNIRLSGQHWRKELAYAKKKSFGDTAYQPKALQENNEKVRAV
jgi:hypothetical protein